MPKLKFQSPEGKTITVDYNAGTVNIASKSSGGGSSTGTSSMYNPGSGTGYYSGGKWIDTGAD